MSVEVRQITTEDIFTVAHMLSKVAKGARIELAQALKAKKTDPTEFGMLIFQSIFLETEEDLKVWLADLIGKTREDFSKMPATTLIDIIESLMHQEGITDFLARASQLVSKVGE